ncbi:3468_t:CDS:2, partial [Funneliformis geosporum]
PGHLVAAIERKKQVVVITNETFAVSDHNFTKCSLIPSVIMLCNIPDNIDESFYREQVNISLKDAAFQASKSIKYTCDTTFRGFSELSSSKHRREINVNINEDNEKENNGENLMETDSHNDPIAELFKLVQVNRKHTCSSPIEKPYFVAGIFPQICNVCRILEDLIQVENELPYCRECHASTGEKRKMGSPINN